MNPHAMRAWLLFAALLGLIFQLFQLFHDQSQFIANTPGIRVSTANGMHYDDPPPDPAVARLQAALGASNPNAQPEIQIDEPKSVDIMPGLNRPNNVVDTTKIRSLSSFVGKNTRGALERARQGVTARQDQIRRAERAYQQQLEEQQASGVADQVEQQPPPPPIPLPEVPIADGAAEQQQQQVTPPSESQALDQTVQTDVQVQIKSQSSKHPQIYGQPAIPTQYTLPKPRITNQTYVVIVLTARDNFEKRTAIRDTWAKGNDNVYFVIGGPLPEDAQDKDLNNPLSVSSLLHREQEEFGDIIDAIHPDTYKSLPYKMHFGMRWAYNNIPNVEFVVKADDDVVVRVKLLHYFVLRQFNPEHPMVIGTIAVGAKPHRQGKWAEDPRYTADEYPPWAFGSAGYVVTRPIAKFLATNEFYYYQGEDAGLGIWLAEGPLQVTWVDSPELRKDEGCHDKFYIIGHDMTTEGIHKCFNKVGDEVPERPHIIAFSAGRKGVFPDRIRNPA